MKAVLEFFVHDQVFKHGHGGVQHDSGVHQVSTTAMLGRLGNLALWFRIALWHYRHQQAYLEFRGFAFQYFLCMAYPLLGFRLEDSLFNGMIPPNRESLLSTFCFAAEFGSMLCCSISSQRNPCRILQKDLSLPDGVLLSLARFIIAGMA